MADTFKVGDVVQLMSGGPKMTVVKVDRLPSGGDTFIVASWFAGSKHEKANFPPDALKRADDDGETKK